tara:strand:- start:516 stop:680 length:165 start_codon:yes stop_codon:yes gene_type:complete
VYIRGAKTEPSVIRRRLPNKTIINIIGKSQNFFLSLRKVKSSIRKSTLILKIDF